MTISVCPVYNFDQVSLKKASSILYECIVPICEANGVKLFHYGNQSSKEIEIPIEIYHEAKQEYRLFDVKRIQKAFKALNEVISSQPKLPQDSLGVRYILEKFQEEPISTGDAIAEMLINGYTANFVPKFPSYKNQLRVNCQFYIEPHI